MSRTPASNQAADASGGKRGEILKIAAASFLSRGYRGASINAMARWSGVSKGSIYRYFDGKEALFKAVIDNELSACQREPGAVVRNAERRPLHEALLETATELVMSMTSDRTLAFRRLIFQEAVRRPELGRHYYSIGPARDYQSLTSLFRANRAMTAFQPADLARYFLGMLLHTVTLERECALRSPLGRKEAGRHAARVVNDFLVAYFRPAEAGE